MTVLVGSILVGSFCDDIRSADKKSSDEGGIDLAALMAYEPEPLAVRSFAIGDFLTVEIPVDESVVEDFLAGSELVRCNVAAARAAPQDRLDLAQARGERARSILSKINSAENALRSCCRDASVDINAALADFDTMLEAEIEHVLWVADQPRKDRCLAFVEDSCRSLAIARELTVEHLLKIVYEGNAIHPACVAPRTFHGEAYSRACSYTIKIDGRARAVINVEDEGTSVSDQKRPKKGEHKVTVEASCPQDHYGSARVVAEFTDTLQFPAKREPPVKLPWRQWGYKFKSIEAPVDRLQTPGCSQ